MSARGHVHCVVGVLSAEADLGLVLGYVVI